MYNYYKIILQRENLTAPSALGSQIFLGCAMERPFFSVPVLSFLVSVCFATLLVLRSVSVRVQRNRSVGNMEDSVQRRWPVWLREEESLNLGQAIGGGGEGPSAQPEALSTGGFFLVWEALALLFRIFNRLGQAPPDYLGRSS